MAKDQLILPLHGLRGLAAVTVVVGHFEIVTGAASLGVVLFFVLSGFLIGRLYLSKNYSKEAVYEYAIARFARVYPLFAVVILLTGLLNWLVPSADVFQLAPDDVWMHLVLAGSAFTVWTVSVEFQFYAVFVLIWFLSSRIHCRRGLLLGLLIASIALAACFGNSAHRINLFGYMPIFLMGLIVSDLSADWLVGRRIRVDQLSVLLVAAFVLSHLVTPRIYDTRFIYLDPVSVAICTGLVFCAVWGDAAGFVNRILSAKVMVWLGEISFGVYLLHRHVQWAIDTLGDSLGGAFGFLIKIIVTLLLAQLANLVIERPLRTKLRNVAACWRA